MEDSSSTMPEVTITGHTVNDIRTPTSLDKTGSDAMNPAGDYSMAYLTLHTTTPGLEGYGMTFTIGRGTDLVCAAISTLAARLHTKPLRTLTSNWARTWRWLTSDSQTRWLGPEKGVVHLALAAVVNALWDLHARTQHKPLWLLLCTLPPAALVSLLDFRYLTDAITAADVAALLAAAAPGRPARLAAALRGRAVRAYTTTPGWLGYSDARLREELRAAQRAGFAHVKMKVGAELADDVRRLGIAREELGAETTLMVDANQVWDVAGAVGWVRALAGFGLWFVEEPTAPDDVLGHAAIREALRPVGVGVATGEMCHNRVMWKQMLQARAVDVAQLDAARLGGVNEVLVVMAMCRKFGVPVVMHSGGIGLPEMTVQMATVNYVLFGEEGEEGLLEFQSSGGSNFVEPATCEEGWFVSPVMEGYGVKLKPGVVEEFGFPDGRFWNTEEGLRIRAEDGGKWE